MRVLFEDNEKKTTSVVDF